MFSPRDAWLLAVLAIIVVPVDLAPAVAIVRDKRVPERLRDIVNVESGLNDGVAAPLFLFCLAGATASHAPAASALENAVPAILIAVAVGGATGYIGALGLGWSLRRDWTEPSALRLGVLMLPLTAYTLAVAFGGNGFVSAFVAGVLFAVRDQKLPSEALQLTEDIGALLSLCVWFVFGRTVNKVFGAGIAEAHRPRIGRGPVVIIRRRAVVDAEDAIRTMIERLSSSAPVQAQGMAMLERILTNEGNSPLYTPSSPGALAHEITVATDAMQPSLSDSHEFLVGV